jgi:endonuclease YncB( thermonuclease family)
MPYMILTGTFHIVGKRPDGDTVAFRPTNRDHWLNEDWLGRTRNRVPQCNAKGDVSLRLEAIDALETHYRGQPWLPEHSQPSQFAFQARDALLAALGIDLSKVEWSGDTVHSAPDGTPGYIATNGIDPYGRVIAFAFAGAAPAGDGETAFVLEPVHLPASVNYQLAEQGLVYPTFYTGLYPALRAVMAAVCAKARKEGKGLWPQDRTNTGVELPGGRDLTPITQEHLIMPKLFRRLVTHLSQNGAIKNFRAYLFQNEDNAIHIPLAEMATLRRYVETDKNRIHLRFPAEELVFIPD